MCGILGCMPPCQLRLHYLTHRGPDGSGVVCVPPVTLGHTRLAILDLTERAAQPKWSADGRVLLTYNGEIYNYKMLGIAEEASDTVALVEWLARQGPDFDPALLDGMYAFAAYFVEERELALSRDPVGIKPLYIALSKNGSQLAFSSELKGFFGIEWFRPKPVLDPETQRRFLQYGHGLPQPVPLSFCNFQKTLKLIPTLVAGVYQICPGQTLVFSTHKEPVERWTYLTRGSQDVANALTESVKEQSMSDVEVGVQLSGGIDSSLAAYHYARNNAAVHGFFVSVEYPGLNEDRWAEEASQVLSKVCRFQFHRIPATEAEVRRVLPSVVWHMDEPPIRHPNALGVYLLCEYVRRETRVEVLLTGEGADELFGGYPWHDGKRIKDYARSRHIFEFGNSPLLKDLLPKANGRTVVRSLLDRLSGGFLASYDARILEGQLLYDRLIYLPPILARQDRMSMAHSIEARVPFLSNRFLRMPPPALPGKKRLKEEAAKIFGKGFTRRAKRGFGFPLPWLGRHDIPAEYLGWLHDSWKPRNDFQRWALVALAMWAQYYLYDGWKNIRPRQAPQTPKG